jgi:hypothetical protein
MVDGDYNNLKQVLYSPTYPTTNDENNENKENATVYYSNTNCDSNDMGCLMVDADGLRKRKDPPPPILRIRKRLFVIFINHCMKALNMTLEHFPQIMEMFDRVNALGAFGGMIHGQASNIAGVVIRAKRLQFDIKDLKDSDTSVDDWKLIFFMCMYTVANNNNTIHYDRVQDEVYGMIKSECSIHDDSLVKKKVIALKYIIIRRAIEDSSDDVPRLPSSPSTFITLMKNKIACSSMSLPNLDILMSKANDVLSMLAIEPEYSYFRRSSLAHASVYVSMDILEYSTDDIARYGCHMQSMVHDLNEVSHIYLRFHKHLSVPIVDEQYMNSTGI